MPYIILVRADNNDRINAEESTEYNAVPAEHLNLDGQRKWNNTGFTSTFEYDPDQKTVIGANQTIVSTVYRALNEGECDTYKYIHFIMLDMDSFGNNQIILNGGTQGFRDPGVPAKVGGTVWEIHQFNKQFPQIFRTEQVIVELGLDNSRYAYEVLLGGNWQKFALCKTYTRDEANKLILERKRPEVLAVELIGKGAKTPSGENIEKVRLYVEEARTHFNSTSHSAASAAASSSDSKLPQTNTVSLYSAIRSAPSTKDFLELGDAERKREEQHRPNKRSFDASPTVSSSAASAASSAIETNEIHSTAKSISAKKLIRKTKDDKSQSSSSHPDEDNHSTAPSSSR